MKKYTKIIPILGLSLIAAHFMSASESESDSQARIPGEFSASTTFVSDYDFRGMSQSDRHMAVQGSMDWSYAINNQTGVHLGAWASNVDFNDSDNASSEFDFYTGLTYTPEDYEQLSFDVGYIYYFYPGIKSGLNYNFWEVYAAATYDFTHFSLTGSVNFSPKYFGDTGDAEFYKLAVSVPSPESIVPGLELHGYIAYQDIHNNTKFGVSDYLNWNVGATYSHSGFDVSLDYVDTDISKKECNSGCGSKIIFSIARAF